MSADLHRFTEEELDPELQEDPRTNMGVDQQTEWTVRKRARLAKLNGLHLDIRPKEDGSMSVIITNHIK